MNTDAFELILMDLSYDDLTKLRLLGFSMRDMMNYMNKKRIWRKKVEKLIGKKIDPEVKVTEQWREVYRILESTDKIIDQMLAKKSTLMYDQVLFDIIKPNEIQVLVRKLLENKDDYLLVLVIEYINTFEYKNSDMDKGWLFEKTGKVGDSMHNSMKALLNSNSINIDGITIDSFKVIFDKKQDPEYGKLIIGSDIFTGDYFKSIITIIINNDNKELFDYLLTKPAYVEKMKEIEVLLCQWYWRAKNKSLRKKAKPYLEIMRNL